MTEKDFSKIHKLFGTDQKFDSASKARGELRYSFVGDVIPELFEFDKVILTGGAEP